MTANREVQGRNAARFSDAEAEYLAENFIGRVATASPSGQPHVVPVGYRFDGATITFGGRNLVKSLKFRNLMSNEKVAFVVDDIEPPNRLHARGVEVRGVAEPTTTEGVPAVRVIPLNIRSWGLRY